MAIQPDDADLPGMYTYHGSTSHVRDRGSDRPYDGRTAEPFPAAKALNDLATADADDQLLVLARYAGLRAWILSTVPTEAQLLDHARASTLEYLDAIPGHWPEGALLRRLAEGPASLSEAIALLEDTAAAAHASGHHRGALVAREAARAADRRRRQSRRRHRRRR